MNKKPGEVVEERIEVRGGREYHVEVLAGKDPSKKRSQRSLLFHGHYRDKKKKKK